MNQHHLVPHPPQSVQRVEVEGRVYEIIQVEPQAIAPHPQPPQYLSPYPQPRALRDTRKGSSIWDDQTTVILMGLGCCVVGGVVAWVVVKAFAPPVPAPQPQTVIVQPPVPEKKPYTREECRPAGLFGWGSDCYRERGYQ